MASFNVIESPWAFAPIATEYAISSTAYLCLLLKRTSSGNALFMIVASVSKLLAVSAVFTSNLNVFGLSNLPFLLLQMLNEVTLLIWVIQGRERLNRTVVSEMYRKRFKALRVISELLTVTIIFGTGMVSPFLHCNCPIEKIEIFDEVLPVCRDRVAARNIAIVLTPQIRGLSFVIAILAGIVSISGLQFMLAGFLSKIHSEQKNHLEAMSADAPWKRQVRDIYCFLAIFVGGLFLMSFLTPGFRQCLPTSESVLDPQPRYSLGTLSSSLFNASLSISQMFSSDLLFRASPSVSAQPLNSMSKSVDDSPMLSP